MILELAAIVVGGGVIITWKALEFAKWVQPRSEDEEEHQREQKIAVDIRQQKLACIQEKRRIVERDRRLCVSSLSSYNEETRRGASRQITIHDDELKKLADEERDL